MNQKPAEEVDGENFYPKAIYFTAQWCGPCKLISPVYTSLANSNPGIRFYKVDVDVDSELIKKFNVTAMPTFFFYKTDRIYKTFTGADENKLKEHIDWLKLPV